MESLQVPEQAIRTFEEIHGLRVTVHDLRNSLLPFLPPDRAYHALPVCQAVKRQGHHNRCLDFEVTRLRPALGHLAEGRCHVCHAGLVEWMVPVFRELAVEWVLFAGVRSPGRDLTTAHRERLSEVASGVQRTGSRSSPGKVDDPEAGRILEHLRQLAARLQQWTVRREQSAGLRELPGSTEELSQRQALIEQFVQQHHTGQPTLAQLAAALRLSPSRTSHVLHECCGKSFKQLLTDARLNTAMELLRHSTLAVVEVALCSGFAEVAHFHRLFRARMGTTPARYRRQAQS